MKPWERTLVGIKSRCNSPSSRYFKNGIKCKITLEELKSIWFRDKGHRLENPSIDRVDSNGNYEVSNCRYIERNENASLGRVVSNCLNGHSIDNTAYIRVRKDGYIQRSCMICHRERQRKRYNCKKRLFGARSYAP
mgnify:CR=1 FL=1